MSSVYTPTATEHGSYVLPSDGDPAVAESVNQALRDLADSALRANDIADTAFALASQAINGTTGGSYSPAADITINGPGRLILETDLTIGASAFLSVAGNSQFTGAVTLGGTTVNTGTFSSSGTASFSGATTVSGTLTVTGTFSATGSVIGLGNSAGDALTVLATALFSSPATFDDTAEFNGITQFNNNVLLNDDVQLGTSSADAIDCLGQLFLHSRLRYDDTGRVPFRAPVLLPDSNATVGIADGDVFIIRPGVTSSRGYDLSTSGATSGDHVIFTSAVDQALSNQVTVGYGTQLITFAAGDRICCVEWVYLTDMADRADGWWPIRKDTK